MAGFYDSKIIDVLRNAATPLRHRDLVAAIAPNEYQAYSNIGISLTKMYRAGLLDREKCDGRYWHYTIATTPPWDRELGTVPGYVVVQKGGERPFCVTFEEYDQARETGNGK